MDTPAIASRLIGDIFVEQGLISDTQLEQALDEQRTTGRRLGEILVSRFGVSRLDLSSALLEQLAERESATTEADHTSDRRDLEALAAEWSTPEVEPVDAPPVEHIAVDGGAPVDDPGSATLRVEPSPANNDSGTAVDGNVAALADRVEELNARLTELADGQLGDGAQLHEVAHDLRAAVDRMHERFERAESAAGERLAQVEEQLADTVTPVQLTERVHSLTSGMAKLGRLSEELASRLSVLQTRGIDTVAGEVKELRAELADHGHKELLGVADRVADLERRLSEAATTAELDERLEQVLATHVSALSSGLDALAHGMKQVASSNDLTRLRRTVDVLSDATADANEVAVRRLQQLEARAEEAMAADERLQVALTATADRSAAGDERLHACLAEVVARTERSLAEQRTELHARLGGDVQKLQIAAAENLSSVRGSIGGLATQLAEQRRRLEAQVRADVERLDERIEQQEARTDEHAAGAERVTELLEQDIQRLESELRSRLERHADRIDEQRRRLEEVRDAGQQALQAAAVGLTQRLADVERHAATSTAGLKADLGELEEKVAGQGLETAQESAAARADLDGLRMRIDDLTERLEGHEHRTVKDAASAQGELDEIRLRIGTLGNRLQDFGGTTTHQLEAVREDLGKVNAQVEQLSARLRDETGRAADVTAAVSGDLASLRESLAERDAAADERLRSLVQSASARADEKMSLLAEKSTVGLLSERVDEQQRLLTDSRLRQDEASAELERQLGRLSEELEKSTDRIASDRQDASDELELAAAVLRDEQRELAAALRAEQERSVSSLRGELREREHRMLAAISEQQTSLGETGIELAALRRDVVEGDRQRRHGAEAMDARIDETRIEIATVLKKVAEGELERRTGADLLGTRVDALEQQLATESTRADAATVAEREALRSGLELISRRVDLVDQRSQRVEERVTAAVETRSDTGLGEAESQLDIRAELAKTEDSQAALLSLVEELALSHETRLAGAENALQSLGVDELQAQVVALQSQILAQADAAEQLRHRFAEIDSELSEHRRTLQAATDGSSSTPAQDGTQNNEEPAATGQTYLAFAPDNDNRYTMIECPGEQPDVGDTVELAVFGGGALIVTRVTESPLPHDTRPCVYLECAP